MIFLQDSCPTQTLLTSSFTNFYHGTLIRVRVKSGVLSHSKFGPQTLIQMCNIWEYYGQKLNQLL